MFLIALLLGALTLFYIWLKWNYSYWKRNNVPGPEPRFFVGNLGSALNLSEHLGVVTADWYNNFPNEPYIGYFKMLQPAILLRDPDLIKDVEITNFNSFRNNDASISKRFDPLSATNPFFNEDDEWREGRKTISPMFSQSKLKGVLPVMNEVGADLVKFIKSHPVDTDFNAKDVSTRFTTENVIKSTFSIEPKCFENGEQNEFLTAGKQIFEPSFLAGLKFLAIPFLPKWAFELIPVSFVPPAMDKWFRSLVRTNKNSRSTDFQSNDLFQTLLQIQEKHKLDEIFLAGHTLSLFFDGTETSATALSYALYELGRNPQCQEKLYEEIVRITAKYNGKITYEGLHEMIYLEGVILEASRIHPPAMVLGKVCNQHYKLPKTSKQTKSVTIAPGTVVNISILGLHMDPKYYPDPEKFIPERFNEEEQRNRHKGTFLTFGEGPRICLGMRFAMLQLKIALAYITLNFHIKVSPRHKPIVIDPQTILSYPKDGILLQFDSR
ncbi:cytochrome P450 6B1-like [Sitodiplosis mosellana]|uniref:cytochrome P450 6B1-like n=1 Tax=Sitodiplosis mosellana TaxID=263140 RepID=UPI002444A9C3|nr:cytochrome P450 6B1-like [Sitodiplosis mosellana]